MILSLFIGFVLGVAALLFALQNTEVVSLTFMGWHFDSSLALLVLASIGVGILICVLAFIPSALSTTFRIMGLKKENKKLVQKVEAHQQAIAATATEQTPPVIDLRQ